MEVEVAKKNNKILICLYVLVFLGVIVLDQITKSWSEKKFLLQASPILKIG